MRVLFDCNCEALLTETWECEVENGLEGDELHDACYERLWAGEAAFIRQESDHEGDRIIEPTSIVVIEPPPTHPFKIEVTG